jgi:hypothetical protein
LFAENGEKSVQSVRGDVLQISAPRSLSPRQSTLRVSAEQVVKKLEAQQRIITVEALEAALLKNFPIPTDRELAVKILTQMTRFANMKGLNALQSALVRYHNKTSRVIYYQGEPTLGSTLDYLSMKHKASGIMHPFANPVTTEVGDLNRVESGAILLDEPTKARLQGDPQLCEHIRQNGIKLLYPEGWDEGVTPFHQPSLDAMMEKLAPMVATVKQRQAHSSINEDEVIQQVISAPTRALMQSLNLEDSLVLIEPLFPLVPSFKKNNTSPVQKVADQLAPNRLSLEELEKALTVFPGRANPEQKQLILKILNEQAEVYSPMRLKGLIQEKHQDILAQAKQLDIQPQAIFYYIDEKKKSYGLINYQYAQVNSVRPQQFIERLDALPDTPDKNLVVVLDDLASSGDSLLDVYHKMREQLGGKVHLYFAPLVSTNKAVEVFHDLQKKDARCTYCPGQVVTVFQDQDSYRQASPEFKATLKQAVIHLGHRENGLSLAFPYMAPDNNNGFFARHIAPLFTLNKSGCKDIDPPSPLEKTVQSSSAGAPAKEPSTVDLSGVQAALRGNREG